MNTIRRSADRGHADHGWLASQHSFSFSEYYDAEHVEFGPLRVINEDRVVPGAGFGAHGHNDMEIISYVLSGALAHKDSLGNGSTLRPGDVQRMSAGTGIRHSEYNGSNTEPVHFLQIWIKPDRRGLAPSYEETRFEEHEKRGRLRLIASADGADRSVTVHQDVRLYAGLFDGDEHASLPLAEGRRAYVHIVRGAVEVNGQPLSGGDALKASGEKNLTIAAGRDAEVLVFDLPGA
ncbi:MAG: pirin family protein [Panacagrimonas sp.]|jgi:redox-sensitive bicupin YhaK (pirin superfamily)|nr:pirin family protein [Panacagrimonas sp.]MCC2654945.1 pirin family protein [Panacagrimonas sp.]